MTSPGGGSLLIAWQLKGKTVLIVGGGEVASQRIESILGADAAIIVQTPSSGLGKRTNGFLAKHPSRISHRDSLFSGIQDLNGVDMVLTALDDVDVSRDIVRLCRKEKIPVNAADIPDSCDFYFGSQIRDGPLQIMISTNGNGPRIASIIKRKLEGALTGREGEAITKVGELRAKLKERAPGVGGDVGRRRMKWMTALCNKWDLNDFVLMDEDAMAKLLDSGWDHDAVPSLSEIVASQKHLEWTDWKDNLTLAVAFLAGASVTAAAYTLRR